MPAIRYVTPDLSYEREGVEKWGKVSRGPRKMAKKVCDCRKSNSFFQIPKVFVYESFVLLVLSIWLITNECSGRIATA